MVNTQRGEVPITIGGKTYALALKMAGLSALQKRLSPPDKKLKLDELIIELEQQINAQSLEHIAVFLWAALQKYHPTLTERDAMNLIDEMGGLEGLATTFAAVMESLKPDPQDVEELTPPKTDKTNPRRAQVRK